MLMGYEHCDASRRQKLHGQVPLHCTTVSFDSKQVSCAFGYLNKVFCCMYVMTYLKSLSKAC
jgi:hypothetical protein